MNPNQSHKIPNEDKLKKDVSRIEWIEEEPSLYLRELFITEAGDKYGTPLEQRVLEWKKINRELAAINKRRQLTRVTSFKYADLPAFLKIINMTMLDLYNDLGIDVSWNKEFAESAISKMNVLNGNVEKMRKVIDVARYLLPDAYTELIDQCQSPSVRLSYVYSHAMGYGDHQRIKNEYGISNGDHFNYSLNLTKRHFAEIPRDCKILNTPLHWVLGLPSDCFLFGTTPEEEEFGDLYCRLPETYKNLVDRYIESLVSEEEG